MKDYIRHIKFKICKFLEKILSYLSALWKTLLSTLRSLLSTLFHLLTRLITRYATLLLLAATIALIPCLAHHLNQLDNPESIEEVSIPIDSFSYVEEVESTISTSTLYQITDSFTSLINSQEYYELPVSPTPFVEGYVHYYIVGINIQERLKQNPDQVLQEVSNLHRLIQRLWLNQNLNSSTITLSVLSDTVSDTVVISSDNESTFINTEAQLKYIPGDSESEQAYLDFLENKSNY